MRTAPVPACEAFMYSLSTSSSKSPYSASKFPSASSKYPSSEMVSPAISVMRGETAGRPPTHRGRRTAPVDSSTGAVRVVRGSAGAGPPAAEHVEALGEHFFEVLHGTTLEE